MSTLEESFAALQEAAQKFCSELKSAGVRCGALPKQMDAVCETADDLLATLALSAQEIIAKLRALGLADPVYKVRPTTVSGHKRRGSDLHEKPEKRARGSVRKYSHEERERLRAASKLSFPSKPDLEALAEQMNNEFWEEKQVRNASGLLLQWRAMEKAGEFLPEPGGSGQS
eukprot:Amastigsp_a510704_42.p1 type:complete len:172 gc:universal Amastigsp_a510704_42:53-568(+)